MLLYEKKKNSVNVYNLVYDKNQLREYKIDKIELIPEKERLLCGIEISDKTNNYFKGIDIINIPINKRTRKE